MKNSRPGVELTDHTRVPRIWDVYFSQVRLGQMDERILKVEDVASPKSRYQPVSYGSSTHLERRH